METKTVVYNVDMSKEENRMKIESWHDIPDIHRVFTTLNTPEAFANIITEAREAISSNHHPHPTSSGSSGSYIILSPHSHPLGIFKPRDEEPYADLNPRWAKWFHKMCSPCFFGRACLVPNGGFVGEAGASFVDRWLGLEMVPRTEIVQLASKVFWYGVKPVTPKVGSFQLYVNGFQPFTKVSTIVNMLCSQSPLFQQAFQLEFERLVCLDHVIRNTDRTADNWMIRVLWTDGQQVIDSMVPPNTHWKPIVKIAAIDHGLSFPWRHPEGLFKYPYSWESLPQSLLPFSSSLRNELLSILDDPLKWDDLTLNLAAMVTGHHPSALSFLPRQLSLLRGQLWSLRWCLLTKDSTPADLVGMGRLRVEEDGEHFWKRYGWKRDKAGFKEHHVMGRRWWVREEPTGGCLQW